MAPISVKIKHAGKVLDVQLDIEQPPAIFKDAVYQVTGVPLERMKVMIKGGVLKVCYLFIGLFCTRLMTVHAIRMTLIGRRSAPRR